MKKWQKILSLTCAGVMTLPIFAGCGDTGKEVSKDPNTINVAVYKNSYGDEWIYEIEKKFESLYKNEGYKINVLQPARDMMGDTVVQNLVRGYNATGIDMYITGNCPPETLGEQSSYYVSSGLAEELSDLWESKPIGYDGEEESKTLEEKVRSGLKENYVDIFGKTYAVPYITGAGGMVVNTRKLALYGIDTLPTTTNELFEVWTKIYTGANGQGNSEETKLFPFTYMPGESNGYTTDWWKVCMAQYDAKMFNEYWSWQTEDSEGNVTWMEEGVTGTVNDAFRVAAEVMAQGFDINVASYGTASQTLDQAQAQIVKQSGGAVFMCNGNWYLNDMKTSYPNALNDLTFMNFPVVSQLANKLWGDAVTDEAKLETMLRKAISYVDDLQQAGDPETIANSMTSEFSVEVTKEDVEEVRRARYSFSLRASDQIVITKGTPNVEICKLFARMIASEDAAKTISEKANSTSAYMQTVNTFNSYRFVQDASKMTNNEYAVGIVEKVKGYRFILGRSNKAQYKGHIPSYFATLADSKSIYDGDGGMSGLTVQVYKDLAANLVQQEKSVIETNFSSWKNLAADNIAYYRELLGMTD